LLKVAKAYYSSRHRPHTRAKKHLFAFYYDDKGVFRRQKISWLKGIYYNLFVKKYKWKTKKCNGCKIKYRSLGEKPFCPNCGIQN